MENKNKINPKDTINLKIVMCVFYVVAKDIMDLLHPVMLQSK
jgi:hypothetical protein